MDILGLFDFLTHEEVKKAIYETKGGV
jgi:hypothetical protein